MKKILTSCLILSLLLSLLCIEANAVTDQSTGIEYTIRGYGSTLYMSGAELYETGNHGELNNKILVTAPTDVFNYSGDVSDAAFVEQRNTYRQELYDWVARVSPTQVVGHWYLVDGYDRALNDSDYLILKYFNIPSNLKGTKTVEREGVPFAFTGDGKGNIKVALGKPIEGYHEATLYIPEERIYDMTDCLTSEKYSFSFSVPNSKTPTTPQGFREFYTAGSLQEGLQYCKKHADLSEPVIVDVSKAWEIKLNGKISYSMVLNVDYGTAPSSNTGKADATSAPLATGKDGSKSNLQNSANRTVNGTVQENALGETGTSPVEEIASALENTSPNADRTAVSADTVENGETDLPTSESKSSTVVKVIIICAVVLVLAAAGVLLYFLKFKKMRRTAKTDKK